MAPRKRAKMRPKIGPGTRARTRAKMRGPRTELVVALLLSALPASAAESRSVEVLSFESAVSQAIQRNPSTIVAAEEIKRARALVEQTRSASLPTLSANGSYTRLDNDRVLNGNVI